MTDFTATRALFQLPEGLTYLDGNSLGPMSRAVPNRVALTIQSEWGQELIRAWNSAGWMEMPDRLGNRLAPLIGAAPGTVSTGDTLSIKVHQALSAALSLTPRKVILSDTGNFPTDLYIAQGIVDALDRGLELRCVPPEDIEAHLTDEIAVLMLTEVDYRTGRRHDMARMSRIARDHGILTLWDLAHSAGAFPVDSAAHADFAVGCSYKYLNSGPGGPAFIAVPDAVANRIRPALPGWLGHAAPFAFDLDYRPANAARRFRVGTPPILQMAALDAALDAWDGVSLDDVRSRSLTLSHRLIDGVEAACPALTLASPRDDAQRGSQISFRHPDAYAICQALIAHDVIGDFRAPDILRFGITPLYIDESDIHTAVSTLSRIMDGRLYDDPRFRSRNAVT